MYLLLGDPADPCCDGVRAELRARDHDTRVIPNPLSSPHFAWRLENAVSASQLGGIGDEVIPEDQISGVLVRSTGWLDRADWAPDDLPYAQAEVQAALLGWLTSLSCPVINRYQSSIWYQPQRPLLAWQRQLRRCGLPVAETLVTNIESEARAFGQRLARDKSAAVAVYTPLTSGARYLVDSADDWTRLAAMMSIAPVCLTSQYDEVQLACVVGERVVWNGAPSPSVVSLASALCTFAVESGLGMVSFTVAPGRRGARVIGLDPRPNIELFGANARRTILAEIVNVLTTPVEHRQASAEPTMGRQ